MISAKELQTKYNKLYTNLRNYIWPIEIVINIADLELATYKSFPDMPKVRITFNKIKQECNHLFNDDEDLKESIEDFDSLLDNTEDDFYAKLDTRVEVSD